MVWPRPQAWEPFQFFVKWSCKGNQGCISRLCLWYGALGQICQLTTTAVLKEGIKFLTTLKHTINPSPCRISSVAVLERLASVAIDFSSRWPAVSCQCDSAPQLASPNKPISLERPQSQGGYCFITYFVWYDHVMFNHYVLEFSSAWYALAQLSKGEYATTLMPTCNRFYSLPIEGQSLLCYYPAIIALCKALSVVSWHTAAYYCVSQCCCWNHWLIESVWGFNLPHFYEMLS